MTPLHVKIAGLALILAVAVCVVALVLVAAAARFAFWVIWTPAEFLADCAAFVTRER